MGQQRYEIELQSAIRDLHVDRLRFSAVRVTSMRSGRAADRRVPQRLTERLPTRARRGVAAWAYRGADLVHRMDLRLPPARREVVTVHDLPPLRFTDEGSLPRTAAQSLQAALAVIAPSQFAASEIQTLLGVDEVHVIPNGLSQAFAGAVPASAALLNRLGVREPYVLHSGGASTRKNLSALAAAWPEVRRASPGTTLVLCGPPDERRNRAFGGLPGVLLTGYLPPHDVAGLMRSARAVVVPSTYEGFGLPALEGMASGAPVVAADAGALPEVCGDAAVLVAPTAEGLTRGLRQVLDSPSLAASLAAAGRARASGFTWAESARSHVEVYESVLR